MEMSLAFRRRTQGCRLQRLASLSGTGILELWFCKGVKQQNIAMHRKTDKHIIIVDVAEYPGCVGIVKYPQIYYNFTIISYKIVLYWLAALASARLPNRQADAGDSAKHFNETVLLQTWNGNSLGDMCFCWKPDRTIWPSSVGSPVAKQANEPLPAEGEPWWSVVHRAPFQENQEHRMTSKQACCPCLYSSTTSVMNFVYSVSRYIQTTSPLWFGISKVLPSSSIQVQATKKWCERCYRVKGPRVRDCHITSTSKHGKGSRWNKNRLHTAGRQTTCVWHRFLRIVSRQACASGWGGGKVL